MVSFKKKTLEHLPPLPQRLRLAREAMRVTLREVEVATHVRPRYLEALEGGRYDLLPPDVFAAGFVRRYAGYLGLPEREVLTQFRKERGIFRSMNHSTGLAPQAPPKTPRFTLSMASLALLLSFVFVLGLVSYVWWQVRAFTSPPRLTVESPAPNSTHQNGMVLVEGTASKNSTVFINEAPVPISDDQEFSEELKLVPGLNTIEVKAISRLKKETINTINIYIEE